jgi:alpha-1,4-galacturonosyltransferase
MHNTYALYFLLNTRQPDLFLFPVKSNQLFHHVILSSSAGHPSDPQTSSSASYVCISSIQTYSFSLI